MDYDLSRLGSAEFENLIQALCLQELGKGVEIFGDGPDGGREATYRGTVNWDNGSAPLQWNGYVVVQAKFRKRSKGPSDDFDWLKRQLSTELKHWTDKDRNRVKKGRPPEYLLVVTNAVLSSVEDGGVDLGQNEIEAIANAHELDLRGIRVWHYDKVCRLLDNHPGIRSTYSGLITTGDVLQKLLEMLGGDWDSSLSELNGYVSKELLRDRWIRLGQAGHPDDQKVPLASTVIELPVTDTSVAGGAISYVIERGDHVGDSQLEAGLARHIAIIGGPGQGKSTLGQAIAQLYRIAFLKTRTDLVGDVHQLVDASRKQLADQKIRLPRNLRWPVRIDLSKYGEALGDGDRSLLRYISELVSGDTQQRRIDSSLLQRWWRQWPWIVILDGLDEVAAPGVREQVMTNIANFLIDINEADADVLVVGTTRPQGYANEFPTHTYRRLDLKELTRSQALAYSRRLGRQRHPDDEDRQKEITTKLERATRDDITARLMVTPLQVTIMSLLVERQGRIPQDRYSLFEAYFDTIYKREAAKSGPTAQVIAEHRNDIEAIHECVALRLQRESADGTDTDPALTRLELSQVIEDRLREEGNEGTELSRLASALESAATERLVLLVAKKTQHVGFEIRSLQEYCAARALVQRDDKYVLANMNSVLCSAHWRNTWLFAAGRVFKEREHLRADLCQMLLDFDSGYLTMLAVPGARLSAELLADGIGVTAPVHRRTLAAHVLGVLEAPADPELLVIAKVLFDVANDDQAVGQALDAALTRALRRAPGDRSAALVVARTLANGVGSIASTTQLRLRNMKSEVARSEEYGLEIQSQLGADWSVKMPRKTETLASFVKDLSTRVLDNEFIGLFARSAVQRPDPQEDFVAISRLRFPPIDDLEVILSVDANQRILFDLISDMRAEDWTVAQAMTLMVRHWFARRVPVLTDGNSKVNVNFDSIPIGAINE